MNWCSPILSGKEGLDEVEKVFSILNKNNIRVNTSCGFHVHIGVQDMTTSIARNLIKRYSKYEDVIDSLMPRSCCDNNNEFCRSIKRRLNNINEHDFNSAEFIKDIIEFTGNRYGKINIRSYLRHGTVEFRQHNGTLNSEKAINWILFCLNFIEVTINLTNQVTSSTPFNINSKIGKLYTYLREGNTIAPYKAAGKFNTTITAIEDMVRKIRREMGVSIRKNRQREYYMINSENTSTLSDAIQDNSIYTGMPAEVVNWYENRRKSLNTKSLNIAKMPSEEELRNIFTISENSYHRQEESYEAAVWRRSNY